MPFTSKNGEVWCDAFQTYIEYIKLGSTAILSVEHYVTHGTITRLSASSCPVPATTEEGLCSIIGSEIVLTMLRQVFMRLLCSASSYRVLVCFNNADMHTRKFARSPPSRSLLQALAMSHKTSSAAFKIGNEAWLSN
jgi:hypothetical protein